MELILPKSAEKMEIYVHMMVTDKHKLYLLDWFCSRPRRRACVGLYVVPRGCVICYTHGAFLPPM